MLIFSIRHCVDDWNEESKLPRDLRTQCIPWGFSILVCGLPYTQSDGFLTESNCWRKLVFDWAVAWLVEWSLTAFTLFLLFLFAGVSWFWLGNCLVLKDRAFELALMSSSGGSMLASVDRMRGGAHRSERGGATTSPTLKPFY